ncbi:hypothetical protein ACERK3_09405 [Phycisphaerales bacterium AB-hyl4]|uniref:Uncharacterized protein n=1 Tax=Natronomicrosphaera hydrolytica TaxID=3242702 RepID=A0ABV4U6Z0_9BACT
MQIGIGMSRNQAKSLFFDRPRVLAMMERTRHRVFGRFGGFVRMTARRSIRKRNRISEPGQPPSSHEGSLRRGIWYAADPQRSSVVIGPVSTNQVFFDGDMRPIRGTVPEVLEHGGVVRTIEIYVMGRWRRRDLRRKGAVASVAAARAAAQSGVLSPGRVVLSGGVPQRTRHSTIAPRPYMGPAFQKGLQRLPDFWRMAASRAAA